MPDFWTQVNIFGVELIYMLLVNDLVLMCVCVCVAWRVRIRSNTIRNRSLRGEALGPIHGVLNKPNSMLTKPEVLNYR